MILPLILHPEVHQEINTACLWYERASRGLAGEFARCLVVTLDQIHRNPDMYAVIEAGFRRANIRRFPYQVFYRIAAGKVFVLSLSHSHSDPKATLSRLITRDPQH
jgi:hypothetical protein